MMIKAIVFDFDGTMCFLFKNFDLSPTIQRLEIVMKKRGIFFSSETDCFDVFQAIINQTENSIDRTKALLEANEILTEAEVNAVESCELVSGLIEVIRYLSNNGVQIGIASNNSSMCIEKLVGRLWIDLPIYITGRPSDNPLLMKPNPWSLIQTLSKMNCKEDNAIFVGDTKRDYLCCQMTKCNFLGMGSTEKKREKLLQFLPPNHIIGNFFELQNYIQNSTQN